MKNKLFDLIQKTHEYCHEICKESLNTYLSVSGNIGIFCQSEAEFAELDKLKTELTYPSDNTDQKYFELKEPISFLQMNSIPSTIYTHLYIRKFDPTPYGKYLGDVDFVLPENEYQDLKSKVINDAISGASIYDRPGWDTIQLTNEKYNAVAYVSTMKFAEKVRIKF